MEATIFSTLIDAYGVESIVVIAIILLYLKSKEYNSKLSKLEERLDQVEKSQPTASDIKLAVSDGLNELKESLDRDFKRLYDKLDKYYVGKDECHAHRENLQ